MNDLPLRDVVSNPEWLPHAFDADGQSLTFVRVPQDARSELRFLFDAQFGGRFTKATFSNVSAAAAVEAGRETAIRAPLNFIFHTSFCGSTLLARALEIRGVASSMREPAIFTNLANRVIERNGSAERLELVLRLVERPFSPGESVVAKQSSFANRLVEPILRARDESRAVLLYSDVETYLVSLLKRGLQGRIWGRKLFSNTKSWSTLKLDFDENELLELTDIQVASLAWLIQIHHFRTMAKRFGPRVMLLESNEMFAAPAASLHRVMTFFDLDLTAMDAANIAAGPTFAKHSKFTDRDYSVEERRSETEIVGNANAEELSMAAKWIEAYASHHGIPLRPSA